MLYNRKLMKRRGSRMDGAQWYGKLCTAVLFVVLLLVYDLSVAVRVYSRQQEVSPEQRAVIEDNGQSYENPY